MRKDLLVLSGYLVGISCLGLITYRTLSAVGTGSTTITVYVNQYGEQYLDIALLVLLWAVCLIGFLSLPSSRNETRKMRTFKVYDHHATDKGPQGVPSEVSRYLRDEPPKVHPHGLRAPTAEHAERFSELEEGAESTIFAGKKKGTP